MRSVVMQAIIRAVRGAVLSPLYALGRVVMRDGKVETFDLDPIPFRPGERTLDAAGEARVAQVVHVLETHPELRIQLRGEVAAADLDRMRDEAVLAQLGTDKASAGLRAYLEARLGGAPPPPLHDAEAARWESLRNAVPFPAEELRTLAVDRAAAAVGAMTLQHKLDPARISTTPPTPPQEGQLAAQPQVPIELHER